MEKEELLAKGMSLSDARKQLSSFLPYTERAQRKYYYRLFCHFEIEIPYDRFKLLSIGMDKPANENELRLKTGIANYLSLLSEATLAPDDVDGKSIENSIADLIKELSTEPIGLSYHIKINLGLVRRGLGSLRPTARDLLVRWNEADLLSAVFEEKRMPKEFVRQSCISQEALLSKLSHTLPHFSIEKAFLFGSFAYGQQTAFSDIDLAVLFKGGLTADEREGLVKSIEEKVQSSLRMLTDVREIVSTEEISSNAEYKNAMEIEIL